MIGQRPDRFFDLDAEMAAGMNGVFVPTFRIEAGKRALALGLRGPAKDLAAMAQDVIEATGERYSLSDLHRLQAALAKADGDSEGAESSLTRRSTSPGSRAPNFGNCARASTSHASGWNKVETLTLSLF